MSTTSEPSKSLNTNQWYHLRGEIQGSEAKLYIDGELLLTWDHANVDLGDGKLGLCTDVNRVNFDNARIYPPYGLATTTTYDPLVLQPSVQTDESGISIVSRYDLFGRLKSMEYLDDDPFREVSFTYSRQGTTAFDPDDPNYIEVKDYRGSGDSTVTRSYFDGIGRPIQTIQHEGTGSVKAAATYDSAGRDSIAVKPFDSSNKTYATAPVTDANTYYDDRYQYYAGENPPPASDTSPYSYSKTTYYSDPLGRINKRYAPGDDWVGANRAMTLEYLSNSGSEVTGYSANKLFKMRRTDEDSKVVETFTDIFGNQVATKVDSGGLDYLTLFEYDVLGNLTESKDPRGLKTTYSYNTLSQLIEKSSPDADTSEYLYYPNGNLRLMQDAKGADEDYFVYYKYDDFNRRIEEGTVGDLNYFIQDSADVLEFPQSDSSFKAKYYYDQSAFNVSATQENLAGRLVAIEYASDRFDVRGWEFFSYDEDGNVAWLEKYIPKNNSADDYSSIPVKLEYTYDRQGNLTKIVFRRSLPLAGVWIDHLYLWYDYDDLGRLAKVFTNSSDVKPSTADAEYSYWPTGQVERLLLGGTTQGVDYLYNSRYWLTQINHQNLSSSQDPGGDGSNGVTVDRFAQVIGYNKKIQIANDTDYTFDDQFAGNISWTTHNTKDNTDPQGLTGWVYQYDKANRLTEANWGYYSSGWLASGKYDLLSISYDANGNLEYMTRKDNGGSATNMDYNYISSTNKLNYVQNLNGQTSGNYVYDVNGNLTQDKAKLGSSNTLTYNFKNLPTQIPSGSDIIDLDYDADGQRISKNELIYVRDIDGKVIAVYKTDGTHLYWNIWGMDLIGQKFWIQ